MAPPAGPPARPAHWESDVVLSDGGIAHVRPISPADGDRLAALHSGLSEETRRHWPFSPPPGPSTEQVEQFDNGERVVLVAEASDKLIAVARYDVVPDTDAAEVVFVVADEHQGRGIGTILLEHLAAIARERSIDRFDAHVLLENRRMLDVFRSAGFEERTSTDSGVIRVELHIEPTDAGRAVMEAREHRAEATSVARLLTPRSVAVIGASRNRGSVGHQVLRNLLAGDFAGPVYPVNPGADAVASVRAYPTVSDIPGPVDLAVVAVPAAAVLGVVNDCAAKGVAGMVVLTAGFGEVGAREAELQIRTIARRHGMRLVGPNCIGIVNTTIGLNATFAPTAPSPGRIAMQSQSGAVGIVLLERSARMGLGVSTFVSVGNKADVSGNDLLQYWEEDPNTDVVLLYLESFGNPRKFARIARRVSRIKPIVAVKSGRSTAGVRAASSHTAAMASPDVAVDALFQQAGVIRVDTLDELFDMALLLSAQPLPAGRGVAIVGNSGGPGILAADACAAAGLTVAELSEETQRALGAIADPNAAVGNPVDLVASATAVTYEQALRVVLADEAVDAALVIATRTFAAPPPEVADALRRVDGATTKPVVGCFLAADLPPLIQGDAAGRGLPVFDTPEPAVRALARAATYATWRQRPPGRLPDLPGFDGARAKAIIEDFLARTPAGGWLPGVDVMNLLAAAGITVVRTEDATDERAAARSAAGIGFPVALKAAGPALVHKSDIGGVNLGLASEEEVAAAYADMAARLGERMTGAIVQAMAAPGVETILGVVQDPSFGPLVMLGMGGTATELLGDRAFRILPVTDADAADLVRSLRTSPLLFGYRGSPSVDVDALEDAVQRVARLAGTLPELAELDVNPMTVSSAGAVAVDARVRIEPAVPRPPPHLRRMS